MRLTEYFDLISREKLPDTEDVMYSHLEYRDEEGLLLPKYKELRKEYRKLYGKQK
tara:strand:+ start:174 stop:338 length:165 start_codon:yes stop_codon:yes gene_type:complete